MMILPKTLKRAPLTASELEKLTANDIAKLKLTSEEKNRFREINLFRSKARAERANRLMIEERPILLDLRNALNWEIVSIWDLVNTPKKYSAAIPTLLKHLLLPYSDRTREGLARSLAVPEAKEAWPILASEYRKAPMGVGFIAPGDTTELRLGYKDGLACALSVTATEETLENLVELVKDRAQGASRVLLLPALKKSKSIIAAKAILELANDPDLAKEIASW